ncbi:MAG: aromatic ring-hydroxylating dioxygenase subunit alpha [Oceanospirillaceae bacterium]
MNNKKTYERSELITALDTLKDGHALTQPFYTNDSIYQAELAAIFYKEWLFAANECELPDIGDYITLTVADTSIIILRAEEHTINAFINSCRHRGSRLCQQESGNTHQLVCPYHQWTYDLDGALKTTRYMAESFNQADFPLKKVHLQNLEGLLYICLAETPPDFSRYRRCVSPYISPHQPAKTKVAFESTIIEEANWKLVVENNRECYHCSSAHPELLVSLIEMALPDDARNGAEFELMRKKAKQWDEINIPHQPVGGGLEFRCIRLPFREGVKSMTMDGGLACKVLLGELTEEDLGSVRMFRIPNNWHHFLSDHILHFRVLPLGPNKTEVRTTWLVHEDAIEGWDYDPARLSEVWLTTNDQDRHLAEENQRGIRSRGFEPGPYSEVAEFMVINYIKWYRRQMHLFLES